MTKDKKNDILTTWHYFWRTAGREQPYAAEGYSKDLWMHVLLFMSVSTDLAIQMYEQLFTELE